MLKPQVTCCKQIVLDMGIKKEFKIPKEYQKFEYFWEEVDFTKKTENNKKALAPQKDFDAIKEIRKYIPHVN